MSIALLQRSSNDLNNEIFAMFYREISNMNRLKVQSNFNSSTFSIVAFTTLDFFALFEFEFVALTEKCALLQFDLSFVDEIDSVMLDSALNSF